MQSFFDKSTLSPREERKLKALCKRRLIKVWALALLWYGVVLGGWAYMIFAMNRPFNHPSSFIYVLLLALPVYPFKIHRKLFGKCFYANVGTVTFSESVKVVTGPITIRQARTLEYEVVTVTFLGDNGEKRVIPYKEHNIRANDCYYKFGDRVYVLHGLKFPVKVPMPEEKEMACPVCGIFLKDDAADPYDKTPRKCSWCGADFE